MLQVYQSELPTSVYAESVRMYVRTYCAVCKIVRSSCRGCSLSAQIHEHGIFFVDSLWKATDAIRDWTAMISLLQTSEKTSMVTLNNSEETVLIEFMFSAVQKATGSLVHVLGEKKRVRLTLYYMHTHPVGIIRTFTVYTYVYTVKNLCIAGTLGTTRSVLITEQCSHQPI